MPRILITGASGLLGLNLAHVACTTHTVIGVDKRRLAGAPFLLLDSDLLIPGAVASALRQAKPDWVIHCAALANLEACEADPTLAYRLNAELPAELATACAGGHIPLVHISTDAVFDGARQGVYTEQDIPNPLGRYAETKLAGERLVAEACPEAIIARVNFYGWSMSGTRSLAEFFFNNLSAGKSVPGFTDVWFCPMFVNDLADTLLEMLGRGLNGLYHVVGAECMTKCEFGIALARRFGLDETLVNPVSVEQSDLIARRSHNSRLSIHKLTAHLGKPVPTFSTGLTRFYAQFAQNYPQKIRSYSQA